VVAWGFTHLAHTQAAARAHSQDTLWLRLVAEAAQRSRAERGRAPARGTARGRGRRAR